MEGTPMLSIVAEDEDRPGLELDLAGATFVDGVKVEREDTRAVA
jgi:hypothetical protein